MSFWHTAFFFFFNKYCLSIKDMQMFVNFILQHVIVSVGIGTKVVNRYDRLMVELANTAIRVSIFCHVESVQKEMI